MAGSPAPESVSSAKLSEQASASMLGIDGACVAVGFGVRAGERQVSTQPRRVRFFDGLDIA